jgi:hypothetical protein
MPFEYIGKTVSGGKRYTKALGNWNDYPSLAKLLRAASRSSGDKLREHPLWPGQSAKMNSIASKLHGDELQMFGYGLGRDYKKIEALIKKYHLEELDTFLHTAVDGPYFENFFAGNYHAEPGTE